MLSFSDNDIISSSNVSQNSSFSSSVHPTWEAYIYIYADTMFMLIVPNSRFAVMRLSEIRFTSKMLSLHFSPTTIVTPFFFVLYPW